MADTKISALPASTTPLAGTEVLPIVQSGATKQVSVANLTTGRAINATQITLTTGNLIVASGQGIDFSATSHPAGVQSELLDDYEIGTWTPTLSYVTPGDVSVTYAEQVGKYVKVGSQVTVWFVVSLSAFTKGTASGNLLIDGLPYTVGPYTTSTPRGTGILGLFNAPATGTLGNLAYARESSTTMHLIQNANNGSFLSMDDPDANSIYFASVTYWVS